MDEKEINALVDAASARLEAKAEAAKAEAAKVDAVKASAVEEYKKTLEPARKGGFATRRIVGKNSKDEETDAFLHYVRTGDTVAVKAALVEGTDSLGGVLVPPAFFDQIAAIKYQRAWADKAGLRTMVTDARIVDVPIETSATTNFVYSAENAAFDENEPTIETRAITVYKFTKLLKISEELMQDQKANLEAYIAQDLATKWALTESAYLATGSGSSQPYGVIPSNALPSSGTFGDFSDTDQSIVFASAAEIDPDELASLLYVLNDAYAESAVWLMNRSTLGYLRASRVSTFPAFEGGGVPMVTVAGGAQVESLLGRPVFTNSTVTKYATGVVSVALFDPSCYLRIQGGGLIIRRLNELYAAGGMVGIRASFRLGGAPIQMGGFVYGKQA